MKTTLGALAALLLAGTMHIQPAHAQPSARVSIGFIRHHMRLASNLHAFSGWFFGLRLDALFQSL